MNTRVASAKKAAPAAVVRQGKFCIACNPADAIRPITEFYPSTSPLHADGLVPICKSCITRYAFDYQSGALDQDKFADVLRQLDKPYLPGVLDVARRKFDEVYDLAKVSEKLRLKNLDKLVEYYFKQIQNSPTYRKYHWTDGSLPDFERKETKKAPQPEGITHEIRKFWGPGFTDEDYQYLQQEYDDWASGHPSIATDKTQREVAKNLCYNRLQIIHTVVSGDNASPMLNSYNQSLAAGNLKPIEKDPIDAKPLGLVLRDIIEYCPGEFYADNSVYKDVDDIEKYMQQVIGRVVSNTMSGTRDEDPEFSVTHELEE